MIDKLYRLTIALSILAFIGFGIPAAVQIERSFSYGKLFKWDWDLEKDRIKKCQETPNFCDRGSFQPSIKEWAFLRDRADEMASTYLAFAICTPLALFTLFFGSRWVITGKFKDPKNKETEIT